MTYIITSASANNKTGIARQEILDAYAMRIGENFPDHYPYRDEDNNWFVEIPTLERMMDIIGLFENGIIIFPNYKGDSPCLEFYDDWREQNNRKIFYVGDVF